MWVVVVVEGNENERVGGWVGGWWSACQTNFLLPPPPPPPPPPSCSTYPGEQASFKNTFWAVVNVPFPIPMVT